MEFLFTPLAQLVFSSFALIALLLSARLAVHRTLRQTPGALEQAGTPSQLPVPAGGQEPLRPCEIAYLVRGGDSTHALIVLAADLMQRAVRQTESGSFKEGLNEYETRMWEIVKDSVKLWASKKAKDVVIGRSKNPIEIAKRLSFIYTFVTTSLKKVLADAIADPRKIRKYFSYQGLVRIIADFTSAGYKQAFETELKASLTRRGLLVDSARRQSFSRVEIIAAVAGLAGSCFLAFFFSPTWYVAVFLWITAAATAFAARTLMISRRLIPLYEELAVVAEQIERQSARLNFLRFLLKSVSVLNWFVVGLVATIIFAFGLGMTKLIFFSLGSFEVLSLLVLTATNFIAFDLLFDAFRLIIEDLPTEQAVRELESQKQELSNVRPLDSFRTLLETEEYDPNFSKLIAIYGIETLLILA